MKEAFNEKIFREVVKTKIIEICAIYIDYDKLKKTDIDLILEKHYDDICADMFTINSWNDNIHDKIVKFIKNKS